MTFSYTLPVQGQFANLKDEVRFLLRDTVESSFSLADEELLYLLDDSENRPYLAASKGAITIAAKYGQAATVASRSIGDLSISTGYKDASAEYQRLSKELRMGKKDTATRAYFIPAESQFTIGQFDELVP
jgi:hypothetical protein